MITNSFSNLNTSKTKIKSKTEKSLNNSRNNCSIKDLSVEEKQKVNLILRLEN